jgi:hypothetical protein
MIRWAIMIAAATVVVVLTICHPAVLATNTFLNAFVTHEILALLIIVLTITLASVANVHLTITRIIRTKFKDEAAGAVAAAPARQEINSNAWALFWGFGVCVVVLLLKGSFADQPYIVSLANGSGLLILLFNGLVMYEIYQTIFDLAEQGHGDKQETP